MSVTPCRRPVRGPGRRYRGGRPANLWKDGTRVTSRWVLTGSNNGILDTEPNGKPIAMTGAAVWTVDEGGKLRRGWIEQASYEFYHRLTRDVAIQPTDQDPTWLRLVFTLAADFGDRFAQVGGSGSAAVRICLPALIFTVR